jgi:N-acetylglucosamine malate deacetylase 1
MGLLSLMSARGRMLVIAPHADDEVLGAGGAMALAVARGWQVAVRFGSVAGYASAFSGEYSSTSDRLGEARAALSRLGVTDSAVLFNEERHLRLDTLAQADIVRVLETAVGETQPDLAIIPSRAHHHQDHRALADACYAALRPGPSGGLLPRVPAVWSYASPTFAWGPNGREFHPNVFVDVSAVIDAKIEALSCYRSQIFGSPHPRSFDAMKNWCAAWGTLAGTRYAEPFDCIRLLIFS